MANGKKSFVIYCDIIHSIDHLTNSEKGQLFQHLLEYVNDMKPVLEDRVLLSAWKPIERQLKRDLEKWEGIREKRSKAGIKSAEKRANKKQQVLTSVNKCQQSSTNSTVNDNVNVNVNVSVIDYDKFLDWFNSTRTKYLEIPSNINRLTQQDKRNLNKLKESYSNDDFNLALYNLCNDKWANESNQIIPKHFLNIDNFNKYLSMTKKPLLKRSQKILKGWEV